MVSESVPSSVCWRCDSRSFVEDYGNRYLPGAWWRYDCAEFCRTAEIVGILLKILFTCITLCSGFKGGEIVPSLFIGATFGSALAPIFGLPVDICAACGMVGVFCAVTNSPISSLLIAFELFGFAGMPYFCTVIAASYLLSGYQSLYKAQKIVYSKTENKYIDRNTTS